jgi:hypothetical protein
MRTGSRIGPQDAALICTVESGCSFPFAAGHGWVLLWLTLFHESR